MTTHRKRALAASLFFHGAVFAFLVLRPPSRSEGGISSAELDGGGPLVLSQVQAAPATPAAEPAPMLSSVEPAIDPPLTVIAIDRAPDAAVLTASISAPMPGLPAIFDHPAGGAPADGAGSGRGTGHHAGHNDYRAPKYVDSPAPDYPPEARRLRREGIVLLTVRVSEEGLPLAITLRHSSGMKALDDAAIRTVRNWTFQPARLGGQPLAALVEIPIRFRLLS